MTNVNFKPNQRYTRKQKEANDKAWYRFFRFYGFF